MPLEMAETTILGLRLLEEGLSLARFRERFGVGRSGTETQPITLKGAPGQRVVLSGAGLLTGWAPCTEAIAKDNPNYASIYYVDIAWKATSLYQDEQPPLTHTLLRRLCWRPRLYSSWAVFVTSVRTIPRERVLRR